MTKSKLRGHDIEFLNEEWVYSDTKEPTATTYKERLCGHCDKGYTKEGHDGCLGELPGLMNACCGHGETSEAYAQFLDGFSVHGDKASNVLQILKECSPNSSNKIQLLLKGDVPFDW